MVQRSDRAAQQQFYLFKKSRIPTGSARRFKIHKYVFDFTDLDIFKLKPGILQLIGALSCLPYLKIGICNAYNGAAALLLEILKNATDSIETLKFSSLQFCRAHDEDERDGDTTLTNPPNRMKTLSIKVACTCSTGDSLEYINGTFQKILQLCTHVKKFELKAVQIFFTVRDNVDYLDFSHLL